MGNLKNTRPRSIYLKPLVVVQCRYYSTRLPGKAMLPLAGIPTLVFLLRRLTINLPAKDYHIILATTKKKEDNIIAAWGHEEGVEVLRGEVSDVLKRYIQCLEFHPSDIVVRVTADNPLTCPETLKWLVRETKKRKTDYSVCNNIPLGTGVDVFSTPLLRLLDIEAQDPEEREHINLFVLRNMVRFKIFIGNIEKKFAHPNLRMTVDTKEDWDRLCSLFRSEDTEPWRISIEEANKRVDSSVVQQRK